MGGDEEASSRKTGLSDLGGRPWLRDLACDPADDASVRAVAAAVCPDLLLPSPPDAAAVEQLDVVRIMGGITNRLMRVGGVLVRIYGGEGLVDRDIETPAFEALAEWLGPPRYLGRFANGRVEEFLNGYRTLSLADIAVPETAVLIAKELAKLHRFEIPPHLAEYFPPKAALWDTLWDWHGQASAAGATEAIRARADNASELPWLEHPALNLQLVGEAARALEAKAPKDGRLAFCHNDLLPSNIMMSSATSDDEAVGAAAVAAAEPCVRIIDLEYGGINFAAFDVANHLMEYCGGTDEKAVRQLGVPEYDRLPGPEQRQHFCQAYLTAMDPNGAAPQAKEVETLLADVEIFMAVDNLFWGLWAVVQAKDEGCAEFPYLLYGKTRLERGLQDAGFLARG